MMYEEFMEIAGYEVSYDDYRNIIEPMYMALPISITKAQFVKMLDKKRFALQTKKQLINQMKKLAQVCADMCEYRSCSKEEWELERLAHDFAKRFYGLDWGKDTKVWTIFTREYTYPELKRGCTYPKEFVIGYGANEYERIALV